MTLQSPRSQTSTWVVPQRAYGRTTGPWRYPPAASRSERTSWPAGWWLFPAMAVGALVWFGIYRLIVSLFAL